MGGEIVQTFVHPGEGARKKRELAKCERFRGFQN